MFGKTIILGLAIVVVLLVASCGGGSAAAINPDETGPSLAVSGLTNDQEFVRDSWPTDVTFTASASDDSGIAHINLYIDGVDVSDSDTDASVRGFKYKWTYWLVKDYEFEFVATDTEGNTTSKKYTVHVVF